MDSPGPIAAPPATIFSLLAAAVSIIPVQKITGYTSVINSPSSCAFHKIQIEELLALNTPVAIRNWSWEATEPGLQCAYAEIDGIRPTMPATRMKMHTAIASTLLPPEKVMVRTSLHSYPAIPTESQYALRTSKLLIFFIK